MKRGILVDPLAAATVMGSIASPIAQSHRRPPQPMTALTAPFPTRFPGVCTQGVGGGGPAAITVPVQGSSSADVAQLPNQLPTINGIPCNLEHANTCWAMQQPGSN